MSAGSCPAHRPPLTHAAVQLKCRSSPTRNRSSVGIGCKNLDYEMHLNRNRRNFASFIALTMISWRCVSSAKPTSICPSCTMSPAAHATDATTASAGADRRKTVFIASSTTSTCPRRHARPPKRNLGHQTRNRRHEPVAGVLLVIPYASGSGRVSRHVSPASRNVTTCWSSTALTVRHAPSSDTRSRPSGNVSTDLPARHPPIRQPPASPIATDRNGIVRLPIGKEIQHARRHGVQPPQVTLIPGRGQITAGGIAFRLRVQHAQRRGCQHRRGGVPCGASSVAPSRAMKPVSIPPATKSACATIRPSRSRLLATPATAQSASACPMRRSAASRVGAVTDQLCQHGVVMDRHRIAGGEPGVDPHAHRFPRRAEQRQPPDRGRKIPRRILGIDPRLDGMAASARWPTGVSRQRLARRHAQLPFHQVERRSPSRSPGARPAAGCSSPGRRTHRHQRRTRPFRRRHSRPHAPPPPPPRPWPSRCASDRPGAGASSITFWWRRCAEQSRSNRCTTLPWVSANTCTSICRGRCR